MNDLLQRPLRFPSHKSRPWIYTSFVSTLDGKVFIKKPGYWPLGSKTDYEYFSWLRAHADIIIDGRRTAEAFGAKTIEFIHSDYLQTLRTQLGKTKLPQYAVVTNHKDELHKYLHKTLLKYKYQPQFYSKDIDLRVLCSNSIGKAQRLCL